MRRLITLVSAVTAATLWVVGCSSSSDSGSTSTGGSGGSTSAGGSTSSGGSAGSVSNVKCVGVYANLMQSAFAAKVSSSGKCAGSSDVTAICTNDVTTAAEQCGSNCYKMAPASSGAMQDACTSACLASMVTPALSGDCMGCYVTDVGCARDHCLVQCGIAPASQGCADCRETNGCVAGFYACAGVPVPTSTAAGGSGGSGGGMGAAGEAATSAGAGG